MPMAEAECNVSGLTINYARDAKRKYNDSFNHPSQILGVVEVA